MNRTLMAALVAASAITGFAGSASAETLLYGSNANDHKSVSIIDVAKAPASEGNYVAVTSSQPAGNGSQLLIVSDDRTDGSKRLFY